MSLEAKKQLLSHHEARDMEIRVVQSLRVARISDLVVSQPDLLVTAWAHGTWGGAGEQRRE